MEGSYRLPLTRYDTTLGLHASRLNTAIVEETFTPLDITSLTTSYGVVLRQPVYQTANQEAALAIGFDRRRNNTWLLGEPFNISPGAVQGELVVSVLRLSQEWIQRGQNHVLALRSTFNFGLDAFDATNDRISGDPNAKFFSWLGQGQYVQRLFNTQNQFLLRVTGQWTDDPLLALEQISVGGAESVRGYRENQLVRDRGIVSSVEFRVPVLFDKAGAGIVHLAPFFDFGGAWNVRSSPSPTTIYSTGLGLLVAPNRHISAQLYWGYRLRHVEKPADRDPQDLGLHFRVNIQAF
jgi:hemolysin activation/secretion protein